MIFRDGGGVGGGLCYGLGILDSSSLKETNALV